MALRRSLSKRILSATNLVSPSPLTSLANPPTPQPPPRPQNATKPHFQGGFFRRFLQRRDINNHSSTTTLPSFLTLPLGDKLREKLNSMNVIPGDQRPRVDGLSQPLPTPVDHEGFRVRVADVKRVVRFAQMEKVREILRNIPASTITYGELVRVCGDVCGGDTEMGLEFAKNLDECGNVIVLGGVVFLRPDQVAKSMEKLITETVAMPNDPRREELDILESRKAYIDQKARSLVKGELYCGLGFLVLQTLGFMRLTFWELSWDVMEPICFFVTSLHFALAYAFFLRTSKEPSFEGYFQRRFRVKQEKLMKVHKFDVERYNQLCEVFYPCGWNKNVVESTEHANGAVFGSLHG